MKKMTFLCILFIALFVALSGVSMAEAEEPTPSPPEAFIVGDFDMEKSLQRLKLHEKITSYGGAVLALTSVNIKILKECGESSDSEKKQKCFNQVESNNAKIESFQKRLDAIMQEFVNLNKQIAEEIGKGVVKKTDRR